MTDFLSKAKRLLEGAKAIATLVMGILTAALAVVDDVELDANELAAFVSVVVSAVITYFVKNRDSADAT